MTVLAALLLQAGIQQQLQQVIGDVLAFVPTVIAAIIVLVVGFIVGRILGGIVARILRRIGLDRYTRGTQLSTRSPTAMAALNARSERLSHTTCTS